MTEERFKFIEALFDDEDLVAFGNSDATSNKPIDPIPYFLNTNAEKFCINPLREWRKTENVTKIVSLLFEMDEGGYSIEEQIDMFNKSGLPYTTMVKSGSKSVHVIVRFEEPIESAKWQRQWWEAIADALLQHGIIADRRARLVVQLSRVPNSIRSNGNVQELVCIKKRIGFDTMRKWLSKHNIEVLPPKEPTPSTYVAGTNDHVSNLTKFETANRWTAEANKMSYSVYMETGAHMWLFDFGKNCWKVDLAENIAVAMAQNQWGVRYKGTNGGGLIETIVKQGWQFGYNNAIKQYQLK